MTSAVCSELCSLSGRSALVACFDPGIRLAFSLPTDGVDPTLCSLEVAFDEAEQTLSVSVKVCSSGCNDGRGDENALFKKLRDLRFVGMATPS
mmetsp:Transcript_13305/g.27033  ORF Transcript_13305/g.27033 Transcript_13305/m.27033 type:complete len:93 (+) Transcript_13305:2453-2731(+)